MRIASCLLFLHLAFGTLRLGAGDPGLTFDVKSGQVSFAINTDLVAGSPDLSSVLVKPVGPASLVARKATINGPIVGGALQISDARAEIIGAGGYQLSRSDNSVTLVDFIFTLPTDGSPASVSANLTTNGIYQGRVTLSTVQVADLNIPTPVEVPPNRKLLLRNIPVKLTANAAALLNNAFGFSAYNDTDVAGTLSMVFRLGRRL
jgi:hypothetical protein